MAMRLTGKRALVAVAAGLALAGAPAFALTAAPAPAAAAEQAEGVTVKVTGGQDQFTDAINRSHASTIELTGNGDDGKGMFNFWSYELFGKHWSSTIGTNAETVNINSDLTIINRTGNPNAYLYGVHFEVKPGAKLTLIDVNIDDARNEGSTEPSVPAITVQPGGSLETKGKGDIATDNGEGEAWAVKLEGSNDANNKATAVLGAAPTGFMANIGEDGWTADNAGNYGGTYCVTAGLNSDLTITDGRFTAENAAHQAIQSYGSVTIKPASDNAVFSTNNWGDNAGPIGTVEIDGTLDGQATGAKLNATDTAFGYIAPGGAASVGDVKIKATLQLNGAAKAYLSNSTVESIVSNEQNKWKVGTLPAVWLDSDAKLYEQELESAPIQTYSTDLDSPAFSDFKSVYEGDHLTTGQYKAEVTLPSENHAVAEDVANVNHARGLWKLNGDTTPADLESLVNAARTKLTDGAKETVNKEDGSLVLSANLALGKSKVYGEYELTKDDPSQDPVTGIQGEGHAYAFSPVHDLQAGWDVSSYRSGTTYTAPAGDGKTTSGVEGDVAPEGYVFAGWYTKGGDLRTGDADNGYDPTTPDAPAKSDDPASAHVLDATATTGYAYAKFVPASFLTAKAQKQAADSNGSYSVRFITALDSYNYKRVNYVIEKTDAAGNVVSGQTPLKGSTTMAWDWLKANGVKQYAHDYFGSKSPAAFFVRYAVTGVPANYNGGWKVTASFVTPDGTEVTGPEARTLKVSDFTN